MAIDTLPSDPAPPKQLWTPSNPSSSQLHTFHAHVSQSHGILPADPADAVASYCQLWEWSCANPAEFWAEVWDWVGVRASKRFENVVDPNAPMFPRPEWFAGAKLNFAENLLFPTVDPEDDAVAVIEATEESRTKVTWAELRERVRVCAAALAGEVEVGDRVVGFVGNHTDSLVAMLAATSLGCVWSGISPDHGPAAVIDRWAQLEPTVLFADNAVFYNGRAHDSLHKLPAIIAGLPSLKCTIIFPKHPQLSISPPPETQLYTDFASASSRPLEFKQLPADHPVYILFSSGTTGKPKCITHGCIGTLLQHKKEHALHCGITADSVFFQFTTVTWMMWHWLVSGLASGATIVLYDGSPFKPHGDLSMPRLIHDESVTHFGTSAKYLSLLEQKQCFPKKQGVEMNKLQAVFSTAAPLAPSTFEYVYAAFGPDIMLGSITGGTDIISLFGASNPMLPVHAGEIQSPGLGMAIAAFSPSGHPTTVPGDLVCTRSFPAQPVCFYGPDGDSAYRRSYFERFPGVWHHGDLVSFNPKTLGLVMLGRSDGMLKPAGVRFGSAEIYNLLLAHFPTEIEDAICVGRRRDGEHDEVVVLFVKMREGQVFDAALRERVKSVVRRELSGRHVPAFVEECLEIPVTGNGKKVEVLVRGILEGREKMVAGSVGNEGCLEWYRRWAREN